MHKHHEDSITILISMYKENKDVEAIILGGSIAKGRERIDSDIDAMIIVSEEMYKNLSSQNKVSECIHGRCTYEKGYFDLKYFTKDFILKASQFGSEPTRNSFVGTRCVYSKDTEIDEIITKIPVYPVWEQQERILSFYSALHLNNGFFWREAEKANDIYLKTRAATDIVLFGMRMLLAYNERLFPCQKWLMRIVNELEHKPENIVDQANEFLLKLDTETKNNFVNAILSFCDWKIPKESSKILTRFIEDNEQWWYNNRPNIAEW